MTGLAAPTGARDRVEPQPTRHTVHEAHMCEDWRIRERSPPGPPPAGELTATVPYAKNAAIAAVSSEKAQRSMILPFRTWKISAVR